MGFLYIEEKALPYRADHPFTFLSKEPVSLKQVVNTNKCAIQLEKSGDKLVIHSAIDNLIKGLATTRVGNNVFVSNFYFVEAKPTILLNSHHDTVKPSPLYTKNPCLLSSLFFHGTFAHILN